MTEGLIKCSILPPQNFYHPVLPTKMNNKLMFVLCRTCGENMNILESSNHTEEERMLNGTWVMDEVLKAIEMGYNITAIQEIWSYKIIQSENGSKGLFTDFINGFLKLKQEASGWPSECIDNDKNKQQYINDYAIKEHVQLNKDKIEKNAGLCCLAKLMLNSFWEKFGQR